MAGKLEIRVVPKELINQANVPRPETLCTSKPPLQNGHSELPQERSHQTQNTDSPQKPKIERTKSILKQSSKEKGETPELASPKRENITFAPEVNKNKVDQEVAPNEEETVESKQNAEVENQQIQCNFLSYLSETVETQTANAPFLCQRNKEPVEIKEDGKY